MHIVVVGAGAIGTLIGAYLSHEGHQVTLVGRPHQRAALRAHPLRVHLPDGTLLQSPADAEDRLRDILGRRAVDMVIVTVKAYDTESVVRELEGTRASPYVLTLQNGVGNEEAFARVVGKERVLSGAITTPVEVVSTGEVRVARASYRLGLAAMVPGEEAMKVLRTVGKSLAQTAFKVQYVRDYRALKWSKLLMNITANAQAALLGWTPARVFAHPAAGTLEVRAWREALAVMQRLRIHPINFGGYPLYYVAPLIRLLPIHWVRPAMGKFVASGRGDKMPSVYLDLKKGKGKTEVPWLNGAVARHGEHVGVPVPVNATFDALVAAVAAGEIPWDTFRNHPERILDAVREREGR